jgi:hypothetical protein
VALALFALGFAAFAIFEVGREVTGWVKPFVIVPGIVIALMAIMPVRAAKAHFRGTPQAYGRTKTVELGCGGFMVLLLFYAVGAFVLSVIHDEPITQMLPFLVLVSTATVLAFVGPALARR